MTAGSAAPGSRGSDAARAADRAEGYAARWGYRTIDPRRYEARRYGGLRGRLNLWLLGLALRRALRGLQAGATVLDVPCGTGVLTPILARQRLRVVGADISAVMLNVAGTRGPGMGLVRADAERLPFRTGAFDAVICNRFLMHLPRETRIRVLAELAAATRGRLAFTVCHSRTFKAASRAIRRTVGGGVKRSRRLSVADLHHELAAAGLVARRILHVAPLFSEVWVVVAERVPSVSRSGVTRRPLPHRGRSESRVASWGVGPGRRLS